MVMELNTGLMEVDMKGNIKMEEDMEKELNIGVMVEGLKENS